MVHSASAPAVPAPRRTRVKANWCPTAVTRGSERTGESAGTFLFGAPAARVCHALPRACHARGSGLDRGGSMRDRVAGLGLGGIRGDYAVINPAMGAMFQVLRGFLLILWIALLVATVVDPDAVNDNAAVATAVVVVVYALKFGWRPLTARL